MMCRTFHMGFIPEDRTLPGANVITQAVNPRAKWPVERMDQNEDIFAGCLNHEPLRGVLKTRDGAGVRPGYAALQEK